MPQKAQRETRSSNPRKSGQLHLKKLPCGCLDVDHLRLLQITAENGVKESLACIPSAVNHAATYQNLDWDLPLAPIKALTG